MQNLFAPGDPDVQNIKLFCHPYPKKGKGLGLFAMLQ